MRAGRFSFKFSGFAVDGNDDQYYLVGLGVMELLDSGKITGKQTSTITKLEGLGSKLIVTYPVLTGTYSFDADGTGVATITFTTPDQLLEGSFAFVTVGGDDRFWMTSTGAKIMSQQGILADEVVSGEAVRMVS
nr:hypothetical protein [Polymorphobacter sp.]